MDALLASRGRRTTRIPVSEGRDTLLATAGDAPVVTVSTRLDTVPPFIAPRLEGDRLLGRGACDAKGIAAAMICAGGAAARLGHRGRACVRGGRGDGDGRLPRREREPARPLDEPRVHQWGADGEHAGHRHQGRGLPDARHPRAHRALGVPGPGRSAISDMVRLLTELETLALPRDPVLGEATINVGAHLGRLLRTTSSPRARKARLMVRLVSPPDEMVQRLRARVGDRAETTLGNAIPPVRLKPLPSWADLGYRLCHRCPESTPLRPALSLRSRHDPRRAHGSRVYRGRRSAGGGWCV